MRPVGLCLPGLASLFRIGPEYWHLANAVDFAAMSVSMIRLFAASRFTLFVFKV